MAKTPEALVEPALLVWARKSLNLDVRAAAKRAGVAPERIDEWEHGVASPTVAQLRTLADVYKRPLAVFFLPAAPKEFAAMKDFRSAASATKQSPELTYAIRLAHERRNVALDLATDIDFTPPTVSLHATLDEDADAVGARARALLGVAVGEQLRWASAGVAFAAWRTAFESAGILVFETRDVELDETRGFALPTVPLPVVGINGTDAVNGRIFTLFHELVHIALRAGGLCDLHDAGTSANAGVEAFCNRVAAAALLPRDALVGEPELASRGPRATYDDEELLSLANRYSVSREALLRRLVDLGKASNAFYQERRRDYAARFKASQRKAKAEAKAEERDGGPLPHVLTLKYNGRLFSRIVLSAYQREAITAADAWDYLKLRPKHFDRLQAELRWRAP